MIFGNVMIFQMSDLDASIYCILGVAGPLPTTWRQYWDLNKYCVTENSMVPYTFNVVGGIWINICHRITKDKSWNFLGWSTPYSSEAWRCSAEERHGSTYWFVEKDAKDQPIGEAAAYRPSNSYVVLWCIVRTAPVPMSLWPVACFCLFYIQTGLPITYILSG